MGSDGNAGNFLSTHSLVAGAEKQQRTQYQKHLSAAGRMTSCGPIPGCGRHAIESFGLADQAIMSWMTLPSSISSRLRPGK